MVSYTLGNRNPPKKILAFQETDFFYNSGNRNTPPPPPPPPPPRNSLYFREQNFLIFQEELPKPPNTKFLIFLHKKLQIKFSKNTLG